MDKKIMTSRTMDDIQTIAQNNLWQEHVITSLGRQILADVLGGEITQEIPSAYIGYFEEFEQLEISQYPQFISGITVLPESHKKIDILSKDVQKDSTVLTVQVTNIGVEAPFKYNALIIMSRTKEKKIVPFTISAIKDVQIMQQQDIPYQQLFEITMLISSEANVTIELQPIVDADRITFDKSGTDLISDTVQGALEEINIKTDEASSTLQTHENKKVSDIDGVHGMQFSEADGSLMIEKQNGEKVKFESGLNPDVLFKDITDGLENLILKVGR